MSEAVATTPSSAATPAVEAVSVNSGDSTPVTFDDLETLDTQVKAAKKAEKSETKEIVKETVKALDKSKGGADVKNEKSEKAVEKTKKSGKAEETEDEEAGTKEAKGKMDSDKKEVERPKLKAKLGEKELDFDPDTQIPVKINGKEEWVSVKDLQSQYSGKVAYDRKFQEMDRERRQFAHKVDEANAKIKAIFDEADPEMRFFRMAEFAGHDPITVRQKFLEENMNLLEKWYTMSDDERIADAKAFENKILRNQLESQQKMETQRQTETNLMSRIKKLEETHQFSTDDFWNRYDEIQQYKSAGKFQGPVTPEFVAETIVKDRLWSAAANILDQADGGMDADKRQNALYDLVEIAHAQGLNPQQVAEIADELWGNKARMKAVETKVEEHEEMRTGKKSKSKPEPKRDDGPMFFSDIL